MGGSSDRFSRLKAAAAEWRVSGLAFAAEWLAFLEHSKDSGSELRNGLLARISARRLLAFGLTSIVNILMIWILLLNLRLAPPDTAPDLHATLFAAPTRLQPLPELHLISPSMVVVPVPEIVIEPDVPPTTAITTVSMAQMLAPRPDIAHINVPPELPLLFRALGSGITLILKIFVQQDGSISDAHVVKTSGDAKLDEFAVAYVKANWRYIPASISGKPVEDWTTVLVPFKA